MKNESPMDIIGLTPAGTCFAVQHATLDNTGRCLLTVWLDPNRNKIGEAYFSMS